MCVTTAAVPAATSQLAACKIREFPPKPQDGKVREFLPVKVWEPPKHCMRNYWDQTILFPRKRIIFDETSEQPMVSPPSYLHVSGLCLVICNNSISRKTWCILTQINSKNKTLDRHEKSYCSRISALHSKRALVVNSTQLAHKTERLTVAPCSPVRKSDLTRSRDSPANTVFRRNTVRSRPISWCCRSTFSRLICFFVCFSV